MNAEVSRHLKNLEDLSLVYAKPQGASDLQAQRRRIEAREACAEGDRNQATRLLIEPACPTPAGKKIEQHGEIAGIEAQPLIAEVGEIPESSYIGVAQRLLPTACWARIASVR